MENLSRHELDGNRQLEIMICLHVAMSAAERAELAAIRLERVYDLRADHPHGGDR